MYDSNILLVTPAPISHRTAEENIGIGYLAAVLRNDGHKVFIIDGWLENLNTFEITDKILGIKNIAYIGFSCYRSNMNQAIEIIDSLKVKGVKVPFIAGGYGPTFYVEDFLKAGFDYIVRGEAEETIIELTDFLLEGKGNRNAIKGICYIEENMIKYSPSRPLIDNINMLPFPARDTINYTINRKSLVNILSSRGCQAHCIFCSIVAFQKISKGRNWRERTIENFINEVEILYKMGFKYFKIIDDSFIEPPRDEIWCKTLSLELKKRNLNVMIRTSIRADRVNDEIMYHLKEAGFFSFSCGIESGSPTALKRMGKPATLKDNENALKIFKKYQIYVQAGFILFDPFTTIDELEENYLFMKKFDFAISKGVFTEMYAAEGTPFNKLLEKKDLVSHEFSNHGNSTYKIKDVKVQIIYECLKLWHKTHSILYDQTIDPISAPKALSLLELKTFHDLFLELRNKDLKFMRYVLDLIKENQTISLVHAITLTKNEIQFQKEWYQAFAQKVDIAYLNAHLVYDADTNPFIC